MFLCRWHWFSVCRDKIDRKLLVNLELVPQLAIFRSFCTRYDHYRLFSKNVPGSLSQNGPEIILQEFHPEIAQIWSVTLDHVMLDAGGMCLP